jgi:hypothetical protein
MRHTSTTVPLDSSWIASATYAADATLTMHLRNGTAYRYFTVPRAIFEGFLTAPSKGAYFTTRIRNAFPHTQILDAPR